MRTPVPQDSCQLIGSGGGTLATSLGDALTVPAGALSSDTNICMHLDTLPSAVGGGYVIPRSYLLTPAGTTFAIPATLRVNYVDGDLSPTLGMTEANLRAWVWDSLDGWLLAGGTVDTVNNYIDVALNHFSTYSIIDCPAGADSDILIGNGIGIGGDDATSPSGDSMPDLCDLDDDDDGLPDTADADPRGDFTYDDDADGVASAPYGADADDDGPSWDTDGNAVRDGVAVACAAASTSADTDSDGLIDSWEVCKWASFATDSDSDEDGSLTDCEEVVDTNGDGADNFGDVQNSASANLLSGAAFGKDGDFDVNGDGALNFGDVTNTAAKALLAAPPMGGCKNTP
jgi:hypothetical protein